LSQDVADALSDLGLYVFDTSVLGRLSFSNEIDSILCKPTAKGMMQALSTVCKSNKIIDTTKNWTSGTRLALRNFILDHIVAKMDLLSVEDATVLWSLPIWLVHGDGQVGIDEEDTAFASYNIDEIKAQAIMLPPIAIEVAILSKNYIKTRSPFDRSLYINMHLCESSRGSSMHLMWYLILWLPWLPPVVVSLTSLALVGVVTGIWSLEFLPCLWTF